MSSTCILVPSYPGNEEASLLTIRLLNRHWPQPPPLFRIGMAPVSEGDLPFAGDTRSWIEVLHSGCQQLLEKGYTSVYLVLDDHPPVGPCHAIHLNETLPSAMSALDAWYINLAGWDGMTHVRCEPVRSSVRGLRRLGPGFQFHFQLHPALWNLKVLEQLSRRFLDLGFRTAWDFEKAARDLFPELPEAWRRGGYVIAGQPLKSGAAAPFWSRLRALGWRQLDRWSRHAKPERFFSAPLLACCFLRPYLRAGCREFRKMNGLERMRAFAGRFFQLPPATTAAMQGGEFRKLFRTWLGFDTCAYAGPYPIYRNGFLIRGALNGSFLEYLRKTGQHETARELATLHPPAPSR